MPQDASCNAVDNGSLEELYSEFDGGIKMIRSADSIELIEPMVGIEVVAEQPGMANTFKAAGVIPNGNPPPPIVSVGDGAPRPLVVINANAANTMYAGTAANPTRIQVQGTITDPLADLIDGNTLAAVGLSFQINGSNQGVTITRPANDPPRPFQATFNVNINLTALAQAQDSLAVLNRPPPLINNQALLLAQQAAICRVGNAVGNLGFDSVFWKIVDPNGDLVFDGAAPNAHVATPAHWPNTVNTTPPRFFVLFHNPFKTEVMFNQKLNSKKGDGAQLFTKNIVIKRQIWGNFHRYGPFLAGTVDRTNAAPPAIADSVPFLAMIKFNRNPQGQIIGRDIAETMEATAPAPSRDDTTDCPAVDLRINNTNNGKETFLPTGTDAAPTGVNLVAQITPACLSANRNVIFQLLNVTNFLGHCNNAPRPGTPNLNRHDFSFTAGSNNPGPTAAANFDAAGQVTTTLHSKDNGGRVTLQAQLNLPGNPTVLMEIPQDKDGDFLPDVWEAQFASAGGANANDPVRDGVEDIEDRNLTGGAVVHNEMGDGYTALEEYRGFQVTNTAAPPVSVVSRMEAIAFAWGIAVTGTAGTGNLVAGPRVKDVLVHLNLNTGTDGMGTAGANSTIPIAFPAVPTYPTIFPIAFHLVQPADFTNNLAAGTLIHDHDMNWNGDNDGFNAVADRQKALHVRDVRFGCPQILGGAGSFIPDNNDLSINSDNNAAGNPVNGAQAGFAAATLNDVTIFHEIGHIFGLRHPFGTVSNGAAAFGPAAILLAAAGQDFDADTNIDANGTDGLPNGVPAFMIPPTPANGMAEGFVDAPALSYLLNGGGVRAPLGNPLREVTEGNTMWTGYLLVGGANRNNPTQVGSRTAGAFGPGLQFITSVWFPNQQVAAGGFNNVIRGTIFGPTMMDWVVFLAPNAPVLERNLNAVQILLTGQNFQSPPGTNIMHANELRVKTHP
jgi:hypothetical protein